jgi:hypothetical protein
MTQIRFGGFDLSPGRGTPVGRRVTVCTLLRMRRGLAAGIAAVLVVVAAGCGGGGGSPSDNESAAALVPATAPIFVSINTKFSSQQLRNADAALRKFPIRDRVLTAVRKELREYHIDVDALRRAAGPEIDAAVLDRSSKLAVGFARPRDDERFDRVLDRRRLLHVRKDGWTVFASDQKAIDAVENAETRLADTRAYRHATADFPDEAVATAYVARGAVRRETTYKLRWASAALLAHDDGFELQAHLNGPDLPGGASYKADLDDDIPDGSVAAVSFRGLGGMLRPYATQTVPLLGIPVSDLADALEGEGILYVRPSALIPEVTLVTKGGSAARASVDRIVRALAPASATPTQTRIEGATMKELTLGPVSILYGTVDGKLVVTDDANAVRALAGGGRPTLTDDDPTFKAARDAAHMPDETNGWLYLNVADGLPLVEAIAELANRKLPRVWEENLRHVRSVLVYGTRDGDTQTIVAFVQAS